MKTLYLLVSTDDRSHAINTEIFYSEERARRAMEEQYNKMRNPSGPEPEEPFCSGDTDTMLCLDGENVYSWRIVGISEADMMGNKKSGPTAITP